jgi:hypothetical protein
MSQLCISGQIHDPCKRYQQGDHPTRSGMSELRVERWDKDLIFKELYSVTLQLNSHCYEPHLES